MTLTIQSGYKVWIEKPERGVFAREVDYGAHWRQPVGGETYPPLWRVSWIEKTHEVYACQPFKDKFIVLGTCSTQEELERRIVGWADACRSGESLNWVAERL